MVGLINSEEARLTVNLPVVINREPADYTTTLGNNASFSVDLTGTSPLYFQWYFKGVPLLNATNSILNLSNVQLNNAGKYQVQISNVVNQATSREAQLTVNEPIKFVGHPQSASVVEGSDVSFSANVSGTAPIDFQWYFNRTAISGAKSNILVLKNVQVSQEGEYSVDASNVVGVVPSQIARLSVNVPVEITSDPDSKSVTVGGDVEFYVNVSGTTPINYQWRFNGNPLSGESQGEPCYRLAFTPKKGAKTMGGRDAVIAQTSGRCWVAKRDFSKIRMEGRLKQPVEVMSFLVTVREVDFLTTTRRVAEGVAAPLQIRYRFRVEVFPFFEFHERHTQKFSFTAQTKSWASSRNQKGGVAGLK